MMRWQPLWLDPLQQEGYVLVHYRQRFLSGPQGLLFSRQDPVLAKVRHLVISEQGLGYFDGQPVCLYELAALIEPASTHWQSLRQVMSDEQREAERFQMLCFAAQVGTWASQHRFCGSCGAPMQPLSGERAMCCAACHSCHYPRISPCMIALVTRGDEILLARSPHHAPGIYSTLAGFVEPGESIEQCVAREVLEEVGVSVCNPRYIASQSWPFPHSLMLGFHVDYVDGEIVPQPGEIEEAHWFSIHALPALPGPHTIARHLIDRYIAERLGSSVPIWPL